MSKIKLEILKRNVNPTQKMIALKEAEITEGILMNHFMKIDHIKWNVQEYMERVLIKRRLLMSYPLSNHSKAGHTYSYL